MKLLLVTGFPWLRVVLEAWSTMPASMKEKVRIGTQHDLVTAPFAWRIVTIPEISRDRSFLSSPFLQTWAVQIVALA